MEFLFLLSVLFFLSFLDLSFLISFVLSLTVLIDLFSLLMELSESISSP